MRIALVLIATLGALFCGILLFMSLPNAQGGSPLSALCTPTPRINCDYVLASPWSRVGPVPTAALGMLYFLFMAAWYLLIGLPNAAGRSWHLVPVALNVIGIIASIIFTLIMATTLPVWCTWCLAAHAVNLVMLVLTFVTIPRRAAGAVEPARPTSGRAMGVIGGAVAVAITLLMALISYRMQIVARQYQTELLRATNNPDYIAWKLSRTEKQDPGPLTGDFVIGKPDAPHTIVVYSDFECAGCAAFHRYAARLTNLFPDSLRIAFRNYPLCLECNPHAPTTKHFFACEAARAAEAARRTGDWKENYSYQSLLFENASRLSGRPYESMTHAAGIDTAAWKKALEEPAIDERIRRDVDSAHSLGVEATPAVFLDGRRLEAWHILTTGPQPVVDLEATDRLWERLLGVKPSATSKP